VRCADLSNIALGRDERKAHRTHALTHSRTHALTHLRTHANEKSLRWDRRPARTASDEGPESHWSDLNRRPLDYESSALPLSYSGNERRGCPGADSNRDAFRHHPLKMACLPVSPPGHCTAAYALVGEFHLTNSPTHIQPTGPTGLEPATSRVTVECSNQAELRPLARIRALWRTAPPPNPISCTCTACHRGNQLTNSRRLAYHRLPDGIARRGIEPLSAP
jgi:hypothetical protein